MRMKDLFSLDGPIPENACRKYFSVTGCWLLGKETFCLNLLKRLESRFSEIFLLSMFKSQIGYLHLFIWRYVLKAQSFIVLNPIFVRGEKYVRIQKDDLHNYWLDCYSVVRHENASSLAPPWALERPHVLCSSKSASIDPLVVYRRAASISFDSYLYSV